MNDQFVVCADNNNPSNCRDSTHQGLAYEYLQQEQQVSAPTDERTSAGADNTTESDKSSQSQDAPAKTQTISNLQEILITYEHTVLTYCAQQIELDFALKSVKARKEGRD